jgi:hypothetical protein
MTMVDGTVPGPADAPDLTPAAFCRALLATLDAAEGRTRRRKRDQTPDRIGLGIKRDLLEAAVADDPAPDVFEGWLVERIFQSQAPGAVRAMCEQIFLEYRMARLRPEMATWLAGGAPSDDAAPGQPKNVEPSWAPHRDQPAHAGDGAPHHPTHGGDGEPPTGSRGLPNG